MAQASRSVTINVPPEKLFDVIVDYEKYPEFLPEVKKAKVEGGQGSIKEVTYMVDMKATVITYTLKHTAQRPTKLSWTMVKGEMMKGNDGAWTLKPGAQPGTTDATYDIELKLSCLVRRSLGGRNGSRCGRHPGLPGAEVGSGARGVWRRRKRAHRRCGRRRGDAPSGGRCAGTSAGRHASSASAARDGARSRLRRCQSAIPPPATAGSSSVSRWCGNSGPDRRVLAERRPGRVDASPPPGCTPSVRRWLRPGLRKAASPRASDRAGDRGFLRRGGD